jgi:hypothetical protein
MADGDGSTGQASGTGTTGEGQAPTGQQGQGQEPGQGNGTPQGQPTEQQQQTGDQTPDLSTITDPVLRSWVEAQAKAAREARQEAARYRTERNTLHEQVQQFQRQNETDEQRRTREAQETAQRLQALEVENRTLKVAPKFQKAAEAAKVLDPAAMLTLVGGLDAITLDDQGNPTNLDALLNDARQKYPYLFSRTSADAHDGTGDGQSPAGSGVNALIRGRVHAAR